MTTLTKDGINKLLSQSRDHITVQLINIEKRDNKGTFITISDGVYTTEALIPSKNSKSSMSLSPNCILTVKDFTSLGQLPVPVLIDFDIGAPCGLIGNPEKYNPEHYNTSSNTNRSYQQGNTYNTSVTGGDINMEPVDLSQLTPEPINALNTFNSDWVICAMVTLKSQIRTWKKAHSEGKFFSVTLTDDTGEIKMTFFTEQVDKFYNVLEERKCFYISKGKLQTANKRFNKTKHAFEITATAATMVQPAPESSVVPMKVTFTSIGAVADALDNDRVNVLGVIKSISDVDELTSKKTGDTLKKRVIELCDNTRGMATSIELTLWGDTAVMFNGQEGNVLCVSDARKSSFNGVSLSSYSDTRIAVNPNMKEAEELHKWYSNSDLKQEVKLSQNTGGIRNQPMRNRDPVSALAELESQSQSMNTNDKAYLYVRATIQRITTSRSLWYDACPTKDCNRKVYLQDDGKYHCLNGCYGTFDTCQKRYLVNLEIADATGSFWATAFEDVASIIIGRSAQDLANEFPNETIENSEQGSEALSHYLQREVNFSEFLMNISCRFEDDEMQGKRMRTIVSAAYPVVENRESNVLVKEIEHSLQAVATA